MTIVASIVGVALPHDPEICVVDTLITGVWYVRVANIISSVSCRYELNSYFIENN